MPSGCWFCIWSKQCAQFKIAISFRTTARGKEFYGHDQDKSESATRARGPPGSSQLMRTAIVSELSRSRTDKNGIAQLVVTHRWHEIFLSHLNGNLHTLQTYNGSQFLRRSQRQKHRSASSSARVVKNWRHAASHAHGLIVPALDRRGCRMRL